MKIFTTLTLLVLSAFGAFGQAQGPVLRNSVTTNSFLKAPPNALDVLTWDAVNQHWTNAPPGSAAATNALTDLNGSTSNHQFIVIWTAAETSNTFGIQTGQGAGGGTNFFHFPTADNTHSGVMSSNTFQQLQAMQVGSVVLSNFISILGMTNVDPAQFIVSNGKLEIISQARLTNILLEGNTTMGTNGWVTIGDPVNFFGITNWDGLFQMSGVTFPVPGTTVTVYGGILNIRSNAVIALGSTGVDDNTNKLIFNRASYIYGDLGAGDNNEINRYRISNTSVGFHSNDIVRMWELTNAVTGFYTNQVSVDTNSMMFSNGTFYAQRQFGARNVFYDDFNYPTLYGSQITGRKAYGNERYYNSGYMSNYNEGGLLKLTSAMAGTRNFYVAVSNSFIGTETNWTRFGCTFVPYHGTAADGGTNNFANIALVLSEVGDVAQWATTDGNVLHTYFDLINWQLTIEHGCVACGAPGAVLILQTNLLNNGLTDVQWGQPYFLEYEVYSNRLSINFNGHYIHIYDPLGTNYFNHRVATWELTGDGTNYHGAAFDSIWAGFADKDPRLTRPIDAGLSVASDFSLIAPPKSIIDYASDGLGRLKRIIQGGGMTITDNGTNLTFAASGSSPNFMSRNTNIAAQPNVSFWPGTGMNIWYTNNTASNRVDYLFESTATGGGNPASAVGNIQFYTNGPAFGGKDSFNFDPTNNRVALNIPGARPNKDIEVGGTQPAIRVGGTTSTATNDFTSVGIFNYGSAGGFTIYPQQEGGVPGNWTFKTNALLPNSDVYQDLGARVQRWRTNYNGTVLTTNYFQDGYAVRTAATPTLVGTNLIIDGTNSDYYEVFLRANGTGTGLTNLVFTNIEQMIEVQVWNTNGASVNLMYDALNLFTAGQYYDQAVIPVDTNGPTRIVVWRTSRGTNVLVQTRTYALAAGSGMTFTTNYVTGIITLTGGGGTGAGVVQWQTNNNIVNVGQTNFNLFVYNWTDGLFATNNTASNKVDYALYAKTNFNQANVATMLLSNQVQYIPMEFNGSNGISAVALTNLWNMGSNTFKQVTNFVATNLTFTVSNVVKGESIISSFIGNGSYSNTVTILATAGINIKWLNWATNGNYDILIRPNATYSLQLYSDRDTNVMAWVGTDDALVPISTWFLSASNAVFTNLLVQAGGSSSNATVGGTMYVSTTVFTNFGSTSTFTNIATYTVPGNTLTNIGDRIVAEWSGRVVTASTNVLNFGYTGSFTNLWSIRWDVSSGGTANYQTILSLTKVGNSTVHVDAQTFGTPNITGLSTYTNLNTDIATDTGTNSQLIFGTAQPGGLRVNSSITNNFFKVRYEPASR